MKNLFMFFVLVSLLLQTTICSIAKGQTGDPVAACKAVCASDRDGRIEQARITTGNSGFNPNPMPGNPPIGPNSLPM